MDAMNPAAPCHMWGPGLFPELDQANDPVTRPSHYARFPVQPMDFILANKLTFPVGNVVKYVTRFDAKNGLEDLLKARENLDKIIEAERANPGSQKASAL